MIANMTDRELMSIEDDNNLVYSALHRRREKKIVSTSKPFDARSVILSNSSSFSANDTKQTHFRMCNVLHSVQKPMLFAVTHFNILYISFLLSPFVRCIVRRLCVDVRPFVRPSMCHCDMVSDSAIFSGSRQQNNENEVIRIQTISSVRVTSVIVCRIRGGSTTRSSV